MTACSTTKFLFLGVLFLSARPIHNSNRRDKNRNSREIFPPWRNQHRKVSACPISLPLRLYRGQSFVPPFLHEIAKGNRKLPTHPRSFPTCGTSRIHIEILIVDLKTDLPIQSGPNNFHVSGFCSHATPLSRSKILFTVAGNQYLPPPGGRMRAVFKREAMS